MDLSITSRFLGEIKLNNNREWFHAHKDSYLLAREQFETLVTCLISSFKEFDPALEGVTAKECMFRFNRDTRFSVDKRPYKDGMGAVLAKGGFKSMRAASYIRIEESKAILFFGTYQTSPERLKKIRDYIYTDYDEFIKILKNKKFTDAFGKLVEFEDKLKTAPRGFDRDWKHVDLLRHKSYCFIHEFSYDEMVKSDFITKATKLAQIAQPFNQMLNDAMESDQ